MFGSLIKTAFGWLTGGGLKTLAEIYAKGKDSAVESERIAAELARAQLEAQLQVRVATAGFWEMRMLTFAISAPFVLHAGAVGLDTVFRFGWGIPAYPRPFDEWEGAILLSFFGIQGGVMAVRAIAGAIAAKRRV